MLAADSEQQCMGESYWVKWLVWLAKKLVWFLLFPNTFSLRQDTPDENIILYALLKIDSGHLVFHNMLFYTSVKKTTKIHLSIYLIALHIFVWVDFNYNISLNVFLQNIFLFSCTDQEMFTLVTLIHPLQKGLL